MLYRLLRNNKESGPFTALQLKDMGLKPYDLLWTEGRGAAWQYASEITELKGFAPTVEEQPFERFFKRKEESQTEQQPAVATKKTKPRYRISNGQLIMVEAGNMEVSNSGVITETAPARLSASQPVKQTVDATPDWQNVYSEWEPNAQTKEVKREETVEVETKYSESLDHLKKRYAEKVLGEKNEKPASLSSASVKQNIMAAIALVVLAAGGYIGYTLKQKDAAITTGKPAVERADIAGDNNLQPQQANNTDAVTNNAGTTQNNTPPKSNIDKASETAGTAAILKPGAGKSSTPVNLTKENNGTSPVTASQKKDANTVGKTNATPTDKAIDKLVTTDKKEVPKTSDNTGADKPVAQPATVPVAKPANKQIGDYVSVKKFGGSGSSVQNVKLMVSNVSDFPIDLAVVDIQYFDSKGRYQKGETMYVKDINGGNNVEIRVPDSDKASSIKYKVSMVQADQKTLYLVAD